MSSFLSHSTRCVTLFAALCVALPLSQAQSNDALISTPSGYPVDVAGAEIHLTAEPVDGDFTLTGANSTLVLDPGVHTVTGNVTINAPGEIVLIGFDKKKQNGSLNVGGTLILGPDNAPVLALDLSLVGNFAVGEIFNIVQAAHIEGHFSGLEEGDTFEMGDVKLRINYSDTGIAVTVISTPKRLDRTPVIEFDSSLINPTATSPGQW